MKRKFKSLRLGHDDLFESAMTKASWRVFNSAVVTSSFGHQETKLWAFNSISRISPIRSWWRQVKESLIRLKTPQLRRSLHSSMMKLNREPLTQLWWPLRFDHDKRKWESLSVTSLVWPWWSRSFNLSTRKPSQRVLDPTAPNSLIRPWRSQVGKFWIRP